jgi:methylated-DNA-[protein]-cysteine S-methyltransferase
LAGRELPDADYTARLQPELEDELGDYFEGRPVVFRAKPDLTGLTPFRQEVLRACARVPYGKTTTYAELAERVGNPAAARAVGSAMANNPVPIIIPCHRVITSQGELGGFSAEQGVALKRKLLEMEARAKP